MSAYKFEFEQLAEDRLKAIAHSLRAISMEELRQLGNKLFKFPDDPWRVAYFGFLDENAGGTFHQAVTSDGVILLYCRAQDKGIWFLPGQGLGPMQARGRETMKQMIDGRQL